MSRAPIGNHFKLTRALVLRTESRAFDREVLGCRMRASPRPDLDPWEFEVVLGLFFVPSDEVRSDAQYLRAPWLEIQAMDPR